jgi:hypothetical protein
LELFLGWSVIALEFQGHSGHNSLADAKARSTRFKSSKQRWETTAIFFTNMGSKFDKTFPFLLVWRPYAFPVGKLLIGLLVVTVKSQFSSQISDYICASETKKECICDVL